ncbi:Hsp20/alpha crystallin family protein [Halobacteriales archaeon QS_5_70_15]|nr:MAG: Hsp20/alpha crystallin family protein [Halobacteriales archaeon QS_5_70_15]
MRRDDRDEDPFSDFFRELERMMDEMTGRGPDVEMDGTGFGADAHFSVYEEDDRIRVVGDLPGVEKDGIDIKCDGERVTVVAGTETREYEERVDLPTTVDEHSARATFNNGVVEITLERADGSKNISLG